MSKLALSEITIPSCRMPRDNPFPILPVLRPASRWDSWRKRLRPELTEYLGYGHTNIYLPYCKQDGYNRQLTPKSLRTVELENKRMKAIFLLDFGGRLYSLYDKKLKREVFYRNEVMQLANLTNRSTWFSGGVEFNCGLVSHSNFGTESIFAAALKLPNGMPVLRIYEYERGRDVMYQYDAFFPEEDSHFICVRPRVVNPNDRTVPVFWWSNMAIADTPGSRVLVSSEKMIITSEQDAEQDFPILNGIDHSYGENIGRAVDLFFVLPDNKKRTWEAAIHADGTGTIATGSSKLKGRKLFVWGNSPGSKKWQGMLTRGDNPYYEIQTGLARTQLECLPLEGGAEFGWLEIYAAIDLDKDIAHGKDYKKVLKYVPEYLEKLVSEKYMNELEKLGDQLAVAKPDKVLSTASGWGALEIKRRHYTGQGNLPSVSTPFADSTLGKYQKPFLDLLSGKNPDDKYITLPAWEVSPEWMEIYRKHKGAWVYYQQALYYAKEENYPEALKYALKAVKACKDAKAKPFTIFLYARLAFLTGDVKLAIREFKKILTPDADFQIWYDAFDAFMQGSKADLKFYAKAMDEAQIPSRFAGRRDLLRTRVANALDDLKTAGEIIDRKFVVADLWETDLAMEEVYLEYMTRLLARMNKVKWSKEFMKEHRLDFYLPKWVDYRAAPLGDRPLSPAQIRDLFKKVSAVKAKIQNAK